MRNGTTKRLAIRVLQPMIILCAMMLVKPSQAETVSFDYTGVVTSVNGQYLPGSTGLLGETITGRITYDMNPTSSQGHGFNGGTVEAFYFESPPAAFTYIVDGVAYSAGSDGVSSDDLSVEVWNSATSDRLAFFGRNVSQTIEGYNVRLALGLNGGPTTLFSDTSLPTEVPDLTDFSSAPLELQIKTSPGGHSLGLSSQVTSITPVPEPSTFALVALAFVSFLAFAWRWRRAA